MKISKENGKRIWFWFRDLLETFWRKFQNFLLYNQIGKIIQVLSDAVHKARQNNFRLVTLRLMLLVAEQLVSRHKTTWQRILGGMTKGDEWRFCYGNGTSSRIHWGSWMGFWEGFQEKWRNHFSFENYYFDDDFRWIDQYCLWDDLKSTEKEKKCDFFNFRAQNNTWSQYSSFKLLKWSGKFVKWSWMKIKKLWTNIKRIFDVKQMKIKN